MSDCYLNRNTSDFSKGESGRKYLYDGIFLCNPFFIFTLTYRGGEASFGRETADQQQDGEPRAGAGDKKARNMHCKYLGYFCFLLWIQ